MPPSLREDAQRNLYFDNAAMGLPRSPLVARYAGDYIAQGGTYGRGAYGRAAQSTRQAEACRRTLASLINAPCAHQVSFGLNATESLNSVILRFPYAKGRVGITAMEHNAVMRPLAHLADRLSLQMETLPSHPDGEVDVASLRQLDPTRYDLLVVNHASNVNGVVQPLEAIRALWPDVPLLVDASQSIGHIPLDVQALQVDWVAFSGHKGLAGPPGVGVLYSSGRFQLPPLKYGGTGSNSASYSMPSEGASRHEAGTPNLLGIVGLLGALEAPVPALHTPDDYEHLLDGMRLLKGYNLYCPRNPTQGIELFGLTPRNGVVSDLARQLILEYGIEVRTGLHCAPSAHRYLHSYPDGSVRFSLSPAHTAADLDYLLSTMQSLSHEYEW